MTAKTDKTDCPTCANRQRGPFTPAEFIAVKGLAPVEDKSLDLPAEIVEAAIAVDAAVEEYELANEMWQTAVSAERRARHGADAGKTARAVEDAQRVKDLVSEDLSAARSRYGVLRRAETNRRSMAEYDANTAARNAAHDASDEELRQSFKARFRIRTKS